MFAPMSSRSSSSGARLPTDSAHDPPARDTPSRRPLDLRHPYTMPRPTQRLARPRAPAIGIPAAQHRYRSASQHTVPPKVTSCTPYTHDATGRAVVEETRDRSSPKRAGHPVGRLRSQQPARGARQTPRRERLDPRSHAEHPTAAPAQLAAGANHPLGARSAQKPSTRGSRRVSRLRAEAMGEIVARHAGPPL